MLSPRVLVRGNPARAKFAAENILKYSVVITVLMIRTKQTHGAAIMPWHSWLIYVIMMAAYLVPGHHQPPCWLSCDHNATWIICNLLKPLKKKGWRWRGWQPISFFVIDWFVSSYDNVSCIHTDNGCSDATDLMYAWCIINDDASCIHQIFGIRALLISMVGTK